MGLRGGQLAPWQRPIIVPIGGSADALKGTPTYGIDAQEPGEAAFGMFS